MRIFAKLMKTCRAVQILLAMLVTSIGIVDAATFTVTNTSDTGAGSLRDAINAANAACGSGPHTIAFNIPAAGPHTIQPTTSLPSLSCPGTVIDGYSQPGASVNSDTGAGNNASIQVILNGASSGGGVGITIQAANVEISGLAIHSFAGGGIGIAVSTNGTGAVVRGNYIGTDPGGMTAFPNSTGIQIGYIQNTRIGGSLPADRNLITGNISGGIEGPAGADHSGTIIRNNQVGGDRSGGTTIGNGRGIDLFNSSATTGTLLIENNYAVRNNSFGIRGSINSTVQFNRVHGNLGDGIVVTSNNNTIKGNEIYNNGTAPNGSGIDVNAGFSNTNIESNSIYNNARSGIEIFSGPATLQNNTIFGNPWTGINNHATDPISITGTRSYGNGAASGILFNNANPSNDYSATPPTPPHDSDSTNVAGGAPNYPEITSVSQSGGNTNVSGFLKSDGLGQSYLIQLFSNSVAATRQGEVLEDSFLASTDANGELSFSRPLAGLKNHITATATRQSAPIATSPYSPAVAASAGPVFSPSASSFTFPATAVGLSAATQILTITNTGGAAINASGAVLTAGDFSRTTTCGAVLAPAANCTHTFTFTPTATGLRTATLTITTDASGSPHVINLSGTGVAAGVEPTVSFAPSSIAVGGNATLSITIANTNPAAATVNTVTFTYPGGLVNAATPNASSTCGGAPTAAAGGGSVGLAAAFVIASGGSCTLSVTVTSMTAANYTVNAPAGTLTSNVGTNTLNASATLTVTAAAIAPAITYAFSPVSILTAGTSTVTVTISNGNAVAISANAFSLTHPVNVVNATPANATSTCPGAAPTATAGANTLNQAAGFSLPPSGSCIFSVDVTSGVSGVYTGSVPAGTIVTAAGSNAASNLANLTVGLPPATGTLTPASLSFGSTSVGSSSTTQTLTLTNTSNTTPLSISSISASGPFAFVAGTTCMVGVPLPSLGTCLMVVNFNPVAPGFATGIATVTTSAGNLTATLDGTGIAAPVPNIAFSPAFVDFGSVPPTTTSAVVSVTVTNSGSAALSAFGMTTSPPFAIELGPALPPAVSPESEAKNAKIVFVCPTGSFSLNPGDSCTLGVKFTPPSTGSFNGAVTIANPGAPITLSLSGNGGLGKSIKATPGSLDFGSVVVSQQSSPLTVGIAGTGFESVMLTSVQVVPGIGATAAEVADFSLSHDCTTLLPAPAAGCTATLRFRPSALGPRAADLRISGDFVGGNLLVPLDGVGIASPLALLSFSASRFGFGQSPIGSVRTLSMTVGNAGQLPVRISAIRSFGDFFVRHDCPAVLPVGGSCTVTPGSLPVVPGPRIGSLIIESDAKDGTAVFPLEATGCRLFSVRDSRTGGGGCSP